MGNTKKEAVFSVYGKEAVSETLEVSASREGVSVSGFVGKPTFSKSNRTYQTLIVNGRYVVNMTVQTAVSNAFGDFLMKRQYPFFVLYLNVPVDEIDVNVHPNKLDVKFLKTSLVYSVVFEAVSRALNNMDYIKEIDSETNAGLSFLTMPKKETPKIDKAGVNLNPFSSNFSEMTIEEKDKISDIVIDTIVSTSSNEGVRDNFGLGSKLLERINENIEKQSENNKIAFESENYDLKQKHIESYAENLETKNENQLQENLFNLQKNSFKDNEYVKPKIMQNDFA